jgi:hypothetical protein
LSRRVSANADGDRAWPTGLSVTRAVTRMNALGFKGLSLIPALDQDIYDQFLINLDNDANDFAEIIEHYRNVPVEALP